MKKVKKQKKQNRRSKDKYAALNPELNLRSRYELIDYDYIDKLSDEEKKWLNTFTEEYTNANFNHGEKQLHNTKNSKRDCYNRNNARNRDILTRMKASGETLYLEEIKEKDSSIKEYFEGDLEDVTENFQESNNDSNTDT